MRGEWKYEDIEAVADRLDTRLDTLCKDSTLRNSPDRKKIAAMYKQICESKYGIELGSNK